MNVYDFDKTIYDGDSTIDFFLFSLKKDVRLLRFFPTQLYAFLLYKLKIISKTEFKSRFFSFLKGIDNKEENLHFFWLTHSKKIKEWYYEKQKSDDIIISASPYFLLKPICKQLNIKHLIASKVCLESGVFEKNCYGEEKALRFFEKFPDGKIDNFYSDSYSDLPLAKISEFSFLVKKNKFYDFNNGNHSTILKLKKQFFNIRFMKFFMVGLLNVLNGALFSWLFSLFIAQTNISFDLGYIVSLSLSYLLNTFFVFSEKDINLNRFLKFCISYLPNFLLQNVVVYIISVFNVHKFILYAFSGAISFPLTYLLLSFFTFKKNHTK